jgi:hypothetical protein
VARSKRPEAAARRQFRALQRDYSAIVQLEAADNGLISQAFERESATARTRAKARLRRQAELHQQVVRARLTRVIRQSYLRAFELGLQAAGRARPLLPNEERILERLRRNEYAYLENFLTDVRYGEGRMPYRQRAGLYGNALQEVYWLGYLYADLSANRYLQWRLSPNETCVDCAVLSGDRRHLARLGVNAEEAERQSGIPVGGRWGNGVYSAPELARLGVVPQSGQLACTTNCHCRLIEVPKPRGRPGRATLEGPYRSLRPKTFTGTALVGGRTVVTREHAKPERLRYAGRARSTAHAHIPRTR